MNGYEKIIALLVQKLGGDVTILDAELGEDFELEMTQHPTKFAYKLRSRPRTVRGELIAAEMNKAPAAKVTSGCHER